MKYNLFWFQNQYQFGFVVHFLYTPHIYNHQLSRRNLHELDKVALLEAKRPILERQARERQKACLKQGDKYPVPENLPERGTPGETREKLASEIGISGKTYSQLKTVNQKGSDELKEAVREKKIGFHFEDLVRSRAWGN